MTMVKTFIEALNFVKEKPQRIKFYLKDKRLTRSEKIILQCWLDLRDNKFSEVESALENLDTKDNPIIQSQRDFLLGTCFSNRGESHRAIMPLKNACHLLQEFPLPRQKFIVRVNLFTAYYNLKDMKGMTQTLQELKQCHPETKIDEANLLSCWYSFYSFQDQIKHCEETLDELAELKKFMTDHQVVNFYLDSFDYCLRIGDLTKAEAVLEDLKKCRKYYTKANYKFMKSLLGNLMYDLPIYAYDREFHEGTQLTYQMKVIKSFEEHNLDQAEMYWHKLRLINKMVYQENFSYQGNKCLFSLCLDKYLMKISNKKDVLGEVRELPRMKEEALVYLLQQSDIPLKREDLYQKLWGEPIQDKKDLKRLTQMISKLRKTKNIQVTVRKGCYTLEKEKKVA